MFTEAEKQFLRDLVCRALLAATRGASFQPEKPTGAALLQTGGGCFVTYKTQGNLRGCLGCFAAETPIYLTIAAYANYSAAADPRFTHQRLREDELSQVDFDVSVLSPLQPCAAPEQIILGKHGINISDGHGRRGCFLPQVATETGWTIAEFWGHCCADKAGLPYDFWQSPLADRQIFTAEIIEGKYHTL